MKSQSIVVAVSFAILIPAAGIVSACNQRCTDIKEQVGMSANGTVFCHKFSANTALHLFTPLPATPINPEPTGVDIQRWQMLGCWEPTCGSPPSMMKNNNCMWMSSSDWNQLVCPQGSN